MKIEMITKMRLKPPRYVPMLGWVQDSFWSIEELKKDCVIVEGSRIESEVQKSGRVEPVYGSKRALIAPVIDKLFLWIDGVLEEFRLLSSSESFLSKGRMRLEFEVEKN